MSETNKRIVDLLPPLPVPTEGECRYHDKLVDSGKYAFHQERADALRLVRIGIHTGDELTQEIGLARWNRTFPDKPYEQYSSARLLLAVEDADTSDLST